MFDMVDDALELAQRIAMIEAFNHLLVQKS